MFRITKTLLAVLLLSTPMLAQSQSNRRPVTEKEFGERWPLTIDKGDVACYEGRVVVFIDGTNVYALNDKARAQTQKKYLDIERIQKDNPHISGTKVSVDPLIDEGLKLCP